ncbi:MAG TPA: phosphotransferase family protein [Stackebrandtia sp.]|jgi:aminoglycoside phosphotransferase (APT) family kinase protein|uniref:phosphotransferase family protein n=1 Tax=Stackebrandtia sp. TaxID=2023065 RepID=UPI002D6FAD9E|nr:phosphotransferase family protein [Stackebrandtia sp.]HZE37959.1 phosphotransferase family protein [Stackebrandtia sp.]
MARSDGPRGLDLDRLRSHVDAELPGLFAGPLEAQLIPGGKSNLTYSVTDGDNAWVVRRPPLGHVLATAHDMGREYRVMAALADTPVPVPRVRLLCDDAEVLGAPFYVMDYVDGTVYRSAAQTSGLGEQRAERLSHHLVEVLAALHTVDFDAVGLGDFGRPQGFLERQVRRWHRQAESSRSRELPDLDSLHDALAEGVPESARHSIVHGDYRLDNAIAAGDDTIAAVLDWEMATLGDPLTDLGLLRMYWDGFDDLPRDLIADAVNPAAGFPASAELIEMYTASSGIDVGQLAWYEGFACYKLAVILEGIHYRHIHGQTLGEGFASIGNLVAPIAAAGLERLGRR